MADDPELPEADEPELDAGGDDPELEADDLPDDEGDDDPDLAEDPDEPEEAPIGDEPGDAPVRTNGRAGKPQSRTQRTITGLRARAQKAENETQELRSRLDALERGQSGRSAAADEAEERARLEVMTPEERSEYRTTKTVNGLRQDFGRLQFQLADQTDKASFDAKAISNPVYARHADEVEDRLAALRRQGQNVTREIMLRFLLGEKAMQQQGRAAGKQRQAALKQRQRQTARPAGGGRSDTRPERQKTGKTARERLEGVII